MNGDDAEKLAREHLDGSYGLSADIGFEIAHRTHVEFKEWEVRCRIFSTKLSKMVEHVVVMRDNKVVCGR